MNKEVAHYVSMSLSIAELAEITKPCSACGAEKPLRDFWDGDSAFGRRSWCKLCDLGWYGKRRAWYKAQVYDHYGRVCACCGETAEAKLTLDHLDGDGREHMQRITGRPWYRGQDRTYPLWRWLVRNKFPDRPRLIVLCRPCNSSKSGGPNCRMHGRDLRHELAA